MPHRSAPRALPPDQPEADAVADIRPFMASFPTGVSVVTTLDAHSVPHGLTCSSVTSVALRPPTVLVCVRTASPTLAVVLAQNSFALNLLHERARAASDLFASGAPDRFERVEWRLPLGAGGPHLTADAHAVADCAVVRTVRFGDHTAVFAEVRRVTVREDPRPLLYGLRRYAVWSDAAAAAPPLAHPAAPAAPPLARPAASGIPGALSPDPSEGGTRVSR
ncbi:flavin reductase family protein [Streptomyces sp. NPDC087897]|uniref:flavin reductase family protein n=1 Tax=Streptomyces sp. NPDC087897 TaxID=3365817 RepID=UPI00380B7A9C